MKNKELFDKLKDEGPLTAEEALVLDEALESDASEQVAQLVAAQHEDAPSLAWRSELNQKLVKETRKSRKTLYWGLSAAVTTGALATMLMLAVFSEPLVEPEPIVTSISRAESTDSLEDAMLDEHQDAMNGASLGVYVSFEDGSGF